MSEGKQLEITEDDKKTSVIISEDVQQNRLRCESFLKTINRKPRESFIKKNIYANNSKYQGISHIETQLDKMFMGLWETRHIGGAQIVGGHSVIYDIEIRFFHPVLQQWINRCGSGACELEKGTNGQVKPKALEKGVPSAKTMAFKNAAKSIGKMFGRDLNRVIEDDYEAIYSPELTKGLLNG